MNQNTSPAHYPHVAISGATKLITRRMLLRFFSEKQRWTCLTIVRHECTNRSHSLALYKPEKATKKRGGGHKKKIQREPNLHITIGFIFLQYQPPETEATEQEKHKNKRGKNAEKNQGTTGEANETETERSIGQPTHEHQPCLGLRRSLNRRTTSRGTSIGKNTRTKKESQGGRTEKRNLGKQRKK